MHQLIGTAFPSTLRITNARSNTIRDSVICYIYIYIYLVHITVHIHWCIFAISYKVVVYYPFESKSHNKYIHFAIGMVDKN